MEELPAGLYEVLVTEGLRARLDALADALPTEQRALHAAETPDRIAWHLSREIERALTDVPDKSRARVGIELARALISRLSEFVKVDAGVAPADPGTVLEAILGRRPDGSPGPIPQPLIPLLDTTVNGQWDLPSGGQRSCPVVAMGTARRRPVALPGVSWPGA